MSIAAAPYPEYADSLAYIEGEDVKQAFIYMVDQSQRIPGYTARPKPHGFVTRNLHYFDSRKSSPYAFTVNQRWLLFYLRAPAQTHPRADIARIQQLFLDAKVLGDGQITFKIRNLVDANAVMNFVFPGLSTAATAATALPDPTASGENSLPVSTAISSEPSSPRYWWVNQNKTYKSEVPGGYVWSPKTRKDGARNQFYDNMLEVSKGDIIFSFCDTRIKAIGVAIGPADTSPKPDFGTVGDGWLDEGWLISVEFTELHSQPRPKDSILLIQPHLPDKYSPLQRSGDGLQSVYLAEVPVAMAAVLGELIGEEYHSIQQNFLGRWDDLRIEEDAHEEAIKGRTDIGSTTKSQLVKSRRGQGIFKANVRLNEKKCRVTGVVDLQHLRASHIKPWKDSTDDEKLNGCNGLLLAPHVDHLFDTGKISFTDEGDLLISPELDRDVLTKWGMPQAMNVGAFSDLQRVFMEYHRRSVFRA